MSKRHKAENPLSEALYNDDSVAELKSLYVNNKPFPHVVLSPLCTEIGMKLIHDEVKNNLTADFKETDLFKVFQTGELGNIDRFEEKMPTLLALRNAIYSEKFRNFIRDITGCHDINERVDCSINAYAHGCHLLCHDDVIGTRRVSYIIYLTDPDDEWTDNDGGALELYPLDSSSIIDKGLSGGGLQGNPEAIPTTNILPIFNTMALFAVQPGRSYHSVQEVYVQNKPRLSISGWFHGPTPPIGCDAASLKQIMTTGDDDRPFENFSENRKEYNINLVEDDQFKDDMKILSAYVNSTYLTFDAIKKINKQFCKDSSVQLSCFLKKEVAEPLKMLLSAEDINCNLGDMQNPSSYDVGVNDGWKIVGPPHKRRHLLYNKKEANVKDCNSSMGSSLCHISEVLFQSQVFSRYLHRLTSLTTVAFREEVRRFRPGLDYTVAHYGAMTTIPRLDATLCFVKLMQDEEGDEEDEDCEDGDKWDSGDVGGFECYIEADTDEGSDAAEVYRANDVDKEESLLSISPGFNMLNLVMRDQEIMRFVKFVSYAAPSSRFDIAYEYEIVQPEDGEDEEAEEESSDGSDEF